MQNDHRNDVTSLRLNEFFKNEEEKNVYVGF